MAGAREPLLQRLGSGRVPWRASLAWALALAVAAWALMRLFGLDRAYPLIPVVAFTPYFAVASVLAVGAIALLGVRSALAVASVAAMTLVALIVPRALGGGQVSAPESGEPLTVMTANLHFGDADAERVVELVRAAGVDVLAVQELTPGAARRLRDAGLERLLTHAVSSAQAGGGGGGIYANAPLDATGDLAPGTGGFRMPGAELKASGRRLAAVSVHAVPPTSPESVRRWRDGLRALPSAGSGPELRLLLGDFNATLDHAALRDVLDRGYVDAADVTGSALAATWSGGAWPPLTIDHLLIDERIHVVATEEHELAGSDHDAVIADLVLPAHPG